MNKFKFEILLHCKLFEKLRWQTGEIFLVSISTNAKKGTSYFIFLRVALLVIRTHFDYCSEKFLKEKLSSRFCDSFRVWFFLLFFIPCSLHPHILVILDDLSLYIEERRNSRIFIPIQRHSAFLLQIKADSFLHFCKAPYSHHFLFTFSSSAEFLRRHQNN